jgi:hypothetical protein
MKLLNFNEFVDQVNESKNFELILESFNSSILQRLTNNKQGGIDKKFFDTLSKMGVAASNITNLDITEIAPSDAAKYAAANPNVILVYYSNSEKPNPHVSSEGKYQYGTIKSDTVLAVVKGKTYMGLAYDRWASKSGSKAEYKIVSATDAGSTLGLSDKSGKGYGSSGLNTLKKMADVADVVYVIDPSTVPSSTELRGDRKESKQGAAAFIDDKQFKKENQSRYEAILRDRASKDDIDGIVQDAIDVLASQIKDAIASGKKGEYGDVLIGTDPKGRQVKMGDAGNLMSNLIREYGYYASAKNDSEKSEKRHGEVDSYYTARSNGYAKSIKDYANKVKTMNYAW